VAQVQLARMVVHDAQHEHQLQIGHRHVGRGAEEGPAGGDGAGDHAGALLRHSSIAPVTLAEPRSDTPKVSVWLGTRQVCT
jgi:hypothetical protein